MSLTAGGHNARVLRNTGEGSEAERRLVGTTY
jgi:hypothetical protein